VTDLQPLLLKKFGDRICNRCESTFTIVIPALSYYQHRYALTPITILTDCYKLKTKSVTYHLA